MINIIQRYSYPLFFVFLFLFFANNAFAAVKPPECTGEWYAPTLADPNAGTCPSTQTKIPEATAGCPEGQKLVGCGKAGLGASLPVFGCCAAEYKADLGNTSTGFCSKEDVVECYPGLTAPPKPSAGGRSAYKCVDPDGCQGTQVPGVTCPGGVSGVKICCQMDVCAEGTAETATTAPVAKTYKLTNPLGTSNLNLIAKNVINVFLGIVGALALLVFVYAGITYMTAGGAEQTVQKAKDTMKYAVVGVFVIMFSFVLTDTFISLWTVDLGTPTLTAPDAALDAPTQAEQDVVTIKEQQQAAQKAEDEAKAAASATPKDPTVCASKTVNSEIVPIRWCKVPANATEALNCWSSGCSGNEYCCP